MSEYLFGQGKVYVGSRTAGGKATGLKWVGDCSELKMALASEKVEIKESHSGNRLTAASVNVGKTATLSVALREFTIDNLALALYGTTVTQSAGSVTNENLGTVVNGELVSLENCDVSALVITDSAGSPATLVEGTDYSANLAAGSIEMIDVSGLTMPLKAAYTKGTGAKSVAAFATQTSDKFVRYEGINLATNEVVVVEFYKARFNPAQELGFITEDFGTLTMEADVLIDTTKASDSVLGQFARIVKIA